MAEAGPSRTWAPFHHIAAAHHSQLAVFLAANVVQLSQAKAEGFNVQCIPTSVTVPQSLKPDQSDAIRYAQNPDISFPRVAEFSHSDRFLALTGDDKVLRVWKLDVSADGGVNGFGLGKEVMIKHLPKRASVLHWMENIEDAAPEELIVVDRSGDVRSFLLDASSTSTDNAAPVPVADEQDGMDSPTDSSMQILLGHVGMITSIAFVPNRNDPRAPPPLVVTGDRDEHIRISRWGPQRAAHVIERFFLGSRSFVGALAVVTDSTGTDRLISSEGGQFLRVWSLPSSDSTGGECLSINAVQNALKPHADVREREELHRLDKEVVAAAMTTLVKRKRGNAPNKRDTITPTVITGLIPFTGDDGKAQLLIVVEGASAFFHIPVAALLEPSSEQRDVCHLVQTTVTDFPVLGLVLRTDPESKALTVWVSLDSRPGHGTGTTSRTIHASAFRYANGHFEETPSPILGSMKPAGTLDESVAEKLQLYPAITLWPKIETPSSAEIIATRTTRKGRFNHPLDTSLIGVQASAEQSSDATASDDNQRQKLVKTMQGGKRERGRERNREAIRQAQEASQS